MKIDIGGVYRFSNKVSIRPERRCVSCLFFDDGLSWCRYLKIRIDTWNYYERCPVVEIIVEE